MSSIVRLLHESATCLGSGVLGLGHILMYGNGIKIIKYVSFTSFGIGVVFSIIKRNYQRKQTVNERNLILITGCDSGLGCVNDENIYIFLGLTMSFFLLHRYNMALYCNLELNMFVCAACLNMDSEGARKLLEQCDPKRILLIELDIRKSASILHIEKTITNLLSNDSNLSKIFFSWY